MLHHRTFVHGVAIIGALLFLFGFAGLAFAAPKGSGPLLTIAKAERVAKADTRETFCDTDPACAAVAVGACKRVARRSVRCEAVFGSRLAPCAATVHVKISRVAIWSARRERVERRWRTFAGPDFQSIECRSTLSAATASDEDAAAEAVPMAADGGEYGPDGEPVKSAPPVACALPADASDEAEDAWLACIDAQDGDER